MKRKMVALLAAAMVLGSTATFVAAPSASANDVKTESVSELKQSFTNAQSSAGEVTIATVDQATVDSAVDAIVEQILQEAENKVTAQILALAEVTIPNVKGKVTITFSVPEVKAGETIKIGHQMANGTWEFFAADKVSNGEVTATFNSLSPVAIIKVAAEGNGNGSGTGNGSGSGDSTTFPQSGVGVSTAALLAAAGLAGVVVCRKKSN